jgi:hypothetical protein
MAEVSYHVDKSKAAAQTIKTIDRFSNFGYDSEVVNDWDIAH